MIPLQTKIPQQLDILDPRLMLSGMYAVLATKDRAEVLKYA